MNVHEGMYKMPHARHRVGWVIHIGRGFRLLFYLKRACEGLKEREEQVNFTLFVCVMSPKGPKRGYRLLE